MSDDTLGEEQQAHAPLGPSSAEGWSTCADYVNANLGLPNHDTRASAEGTFAHAVSEECLALGLDAYDLIGATVKVKDWTFRWEEDDADLLQPGIEWTRSQPGEFFGEQRVDISPVTLPGQFGTADRAIVHRDVCIVADLKWGRGVPVNPVENKQIMLYALGFWHRYRLKYPGIRKIQLIIDQPRHAGGGGIWECSLDELRDFGNWIRTRAAATANPNPGRTASLKGCQWCRRKWAPGGCATFDTFIAGLVDIDFNELDFTMLIDGTLPVPSGMTPERRSFILEHRGMVKDWLDTLAEEELREALAGGPTPGRKPVLGNKLPAKWIDKVAAEAAVDAEIGDDGFNRRLKTPGQVGKAVTPEALSRLQKLIDPGEKKPVMVSEQDARPAIMLIATAFEDLPDPTTGN